MSPMRHYLYYNSDIILSKTSGFTMFSMRMSAWQQSVLWVTSSVLWHVRVRSAGTTYFSENYFKAMFSFHWISVLLISITFSHIFSQYFFHAIWTLSYGFIWHSPSISPMCHICAIYVTTYMTHI